MCGIAVVWKNSQVVQQEEIRILSQAVSHRGPDGEGLWFSSDRSIALGHRRLAILDLTSTGDQPMASQSGRFHMVYNGEIYNYLEIRAELQNLGHSFHSSSDSEVLLAAFENWGPKCFDRLNGMWAIAIYDQKEKSIFLSRDRYGVKPLYYYHGHDIFLVSSEVQAIHRYLGSAHPLNTDVTAGLLAGHFNHHGTKFTYLKDVYSLPSGHMLDFNENQLKVSSWYQLKNVAIPYKYSEQVSSLRDLIFDACKIRMRSDVPIATCLSGGVDSGSLTSVLASLILDKKDSPIGQTQFKAFCAAFPGTFIDEEVSAQEIAALKKVDFQSLQIKPPTPSDLEAGMKTCDGPMNTLAFYPIFKLYQLIKESGIKVTLDGQGPDEMLGGYRPLPEALAAARFEVRPLWYFDIYKTYRAQGESAQFSSKAYANTILKSDFPKWFKIQNKGAPHQLNPLEVSLREQFFSSPLPGILMQYDRSSMASGVECRMPFMDYRIVEMLFSIPSSSKVGGGFTKRILRDSMRGIAPDFILNNKTKIGFNAPIVDWFTGPLKEWMLDQYNSRDFLENDFFDGKRLREDFEKFLNSAKPQWSDAWRFWPPAHFVWWQRSVR